VVYADLITIIIILASGFSNYVVFMTRIRYFVDEVKICVGVDENFDDIDLTVGSRIVQCSAT